jgi:hypothetical protein
MTTPSTTGMSTESSTMMPTRSTASTRSHSPIAIQPCREIPLPTTMSTDAAALHPQMPFKEYLSMSIDLYKSATRTLILMVFQSGMSSSAISIYLWRMRSAYVRPFKAELTSFLPKGKVNISRRQVSPFARHTLIHHD